MNPNPDYWLSVRCIKDTPEWTTSLCDIENWTWEITYTWWSWGSCKIKSCNTNYTKLWNTCSANSQSCTITNWTWTQTWNWSSWWTCSVVSCNSWYTQSWDSCTKNTRLTWIWWTCSETCWWWTQTRTVTCSWDTCLDSKSSESQSCNTQVCQEERYDINNHMWEITLWSCRTESWPPIWAMMAWWGWTIYQNVWDWNNVSYDTNYIKWTFKENRTFSGYHPQFGGSSCNFNFYSIIKK
jgi:hypothetical protein